jgi:K+-sensing histidine kinase KdpD
MFLSNLSIAKKGIILISLPLLTAITFTIVLLNLLEQSDNDLASQVNAKETLGLVNQLTVHMVNGVTARAALRIKRAETDAHAATFWLNESRADIRKLKTLVQGDADELSKVRLLENILEAANHDVANAMSNKDSAATKLNELIGADQIGMADFYLKRLIDTTESLLGPANRIDEEAPVMRAHDRELIEHALLAAVCLNMLLTIGLSVYFSKNITNRLGSVKDNAILISRREPLQTAIEGTDEIAALDQAFHKSASELQRMEDLNQDLVAIVSHELKTPLTAVQGIFYLAGQGAFGTMTEAAYSEISQAEQQAAHLILVITNLLELEKNQAIRSAPDHQK